MNFLLFFKDLRIRKMLLSIHNICPLRFHVYLEERGGGHKKGHGIVLTKTVSLGRMVGDTLKERLEWRFCAKWL